MRELPLSHTSHLSRASDRSSSGLFITGTDTGVGKTRVASAMAAWYRARGVDVGVMKPIATGGIMRGARLVAEDAEALALAAGSDDPPERINPVCYRDPIAPYSAAIRAGRPVDWRGIDRAFEALTRRHPFVIVEGVGGLAVPLARRMTVIDLIRRLRLPVVVVARLRLGTISHTLLTVERACREGLDVLGVILNETEAPVEGAGRLAARSAVDVLTRWLTVPVCGPLRYRSSSATPWASAAWLERGVSPSRLRAWASSRCRKTGIATAAASKEIVRNS